MYCTGIIECPWLTPNDEAGCPSYLPNRCNCNQEGNYTCEWDGNGSNGRTSYPDECKKNIL